MLSIASYLSGPPQVNRLENLGVPPVKLTEPVLYLHVSAGRGELVVFYGGRAAFCWFWVVQTFVVPNRKSGDAVDFSTRWPIQSAPSG